MILALIAGGKTGGEIGADKAFLFVFLGLIHFFPFAIAALLIFIAGNTGLMANFSVSLIQKYVSNYSMDLYTFTTMIILYRTIRTESEVYGAFLGTYVLLAAISELI